jgi:FkbM family methyltransferase
MLVSARRRELCVAQPTEGGWVHRYRDGITVHPRLGGPSARLQDEATRDHFLYGYQPRTGETVFDVGAGVGGEVRLFSRLVGPAGRVVSIEAHPGTFRLLTRTVALNGLTNVTALQLAVTGDPGTAYIEDRAVNHVANGLTTDSVRGVAVTGETLPAIMRCVAVDQIDLLKMNIEGTELAALRAAAGCLHAVRHIAVSCHDFKADRHGGDWQRTYAPVTQLLRAAGFSIRTRPADGRPWIRYYVYGSR